MKTMKNLIYVLLAAFLAVSCEQAEQKAETEADAEAEALQETEDQGKSLFGFKWNKCEDMEQILKDIQDGNVTIEIDQEGIRHQTNQAHMHRGESTLTSIVKDTIYFRYNGIIRGGNVTFYSKIEHSDRIGYFPFVVLDDSVDIDNDFTELQNHIHLKIDSLNLFKVQAIKKNSNGEAKVKGNYCMFIVTGVDMTTVQE